MPRKIEISHKTIVFTAVFVGFLWLLFQIRDILLQLFVALLLMAILNPAVTKLSKYKIPKGLSVLVSYLLLFGILGLAVSSIIPPLVEQTTNLASNLPGYIQKLKLEQYISEDILKEFASQLGSIPGQIIKSILSLFGNVISILTVAILAFYLLLTRDNLENNLEDWFGEDNSKKIALVIDDLERKLGGWARGQLFLMLLIGVLTYFGLLLLGIPYALPLAIFAGIMEIIPYIGPIVAAVPAAILGFSISPFLGFASIGLSLLIQQLENYVFVPKVMEKSTGVPPIIVLIALAIGFNLAGVVGMIVSVPVVIIIQSLVSSKLSK